ncbi:MAG TPA: HlyD family secretion protein [Oxalicibacterium sp.]|nr:HlyD family secretion protein [Oxalicibacterium sp.]
MPTSSEELPSSPTSGGKRPAPRRRSRILLLAGVIALIAALIWGIYWWVSGRFIESTDDAYLQADSTVVAPKVAGYVAEVYVKSNQSVKKGDPLVRLDNRQYQAQLDQAQATIEARQADLDRATADIKQEQAEIEQAQAQVKLARLNLRHAQEEVDRYVPLDVTGAATSEKLAELRNARDQAQANVEAAQAGLKSAQSRLTANTAQIEQARAQIKAGQASLRQTSIDVGDTIVRAAIDGRVGDDTVRVGQFAQPGTRMMTIVPIQQTYLVANFKETQIGRMRIGQAAEIHIDAMPDLDLHGVIESFSPGTGAQFALLPPENATGNFTKIVQRVPVRIRLQADAQTRERLLPGLSVTVDVDTKHDGTQDQRTTQSPQSNSPQENQRG